MKPVLTDRMAVIGILAGLVLWVCCLTVLWGWAYDSAGSLSLQVLLSLALTSWLCLWRRGWLASVALKLLAWTNLNHWTPLEPAMQHALGSTKEDARMRMRLLSVAAVVAVIGFVLATLCIPLARLVAALLGQWFLFDDYTWRGIETITLLISTAPAAVGLICVLYASTIVRASGGRDTYASAYRDWLWGVALGLAAFAVSWWFGANLIFLVFSVAGLILLAALTAVSRMELSTHPRKELLPFGPPSRWAYWSIAAGHAVLTMAIIVQVRLLGDMFGLSLTRKTFWAFLSLAMLAVFLSRIDRKGKPAGAKQISGDIIGVASALLIQTALIVLAGGLGSGSSWLMFFSVAIQIPIASLGAILLSHQRRIFAQAGGSAGAYLASGVGGVLVAVLACKLLGATFAGGYVLMTLAVLMILAGGADGVYHSRDWAHRLQWIGWPTLLGAMMLLGIYAALGETFSANQIVQPGVWLTSVGVRNRALQQYRQQGVLPLQTVRRSSIIDDCLYKSWMEDDIPKQEGIFAMRRGRWWIACTDAADLPAELPPRFYVTGVQPEPPSLPRRYKRFPPLAHTCPDFFRYARLNFNAYQGCDFYDGVMLAPLPADNPQAWRCYNETTLRRCKRLVEMHNPDGTDALGVMLLRTQVGADNVRRALAVARTYHKAVRSGWAIVAVQRSGLDMLLLGPNEALGRQMIQTEQGPKVVLEDVAEALKNKLRHVHDDVYLIPIETLWEVYSDVAPIQLANPPGERLSGTPQLEGLRNYLETKRRILRLEQDQATGTGE